MEERTKTITNLTHCKITWIRKTVDLTKRKNLEHRFGATIVAHRKPNSSVRQLERTLKESIADIMKKPKGMIRIWNATRYRKVKELAPKRLEKLVRHQHVRNKIAKRISFDDLINLRQHVKKLGGKKSKQTARNFIDRTLKKRFSVTLKKHLMIKIPYTEGLQVKALTGLTDRILQRSNLHEKLKAKYRNTIRFVFTRRESIGDMFTNHIRFIRKHNFHGRKKAKCICNKIDPTGTLPRDSAGHICCKMNESNEKIEALLNISTKNIPHPSKVNTTEEITECLHMFGAQIKSLLDPKTLTKNDNKRIKKKHREVNGKDTTSQKEDMIKTMSEIGISPSFIKQIYTQSKAIAKQQHIVEKEIPGNLDPERLRQLRNDLSGLIFSPLDKNTGCMCISCPLAYENAITKSFRSDTSHYEKFRLPASELIKKYRRFYEEIGEPISTVSNDKFDETKIPYAYVLHKNKDLAKLRPIVSYATHPLKRILNVTCRALNHMIQTIDADHALHCNMETCIELKERIKDFESRMKKKYGKHTRFAFIMGDVKNMYTELTHGTIKKAVDWILQETSKQTRRTEVTVKRRGKRGVSYGRATNTHSSTTLTIEQIRKVVEFDLANAVFAVGDPGNEHNLFRQFVGVPMGSPLSPALAKITCMYFENIFLQKIKHDDSCTLEGLRYMDDLVALGVYDFKSHHSEDQVKKHMKTLTTCYDDGMILEIEAQSGYGNRSSEKETTYLQSNLVFYKNTIEMYENNKNADSILNTGKQKLLRYPHINSYSSNKQKLAICIQCAIAVERYSTTIEYKATQFIKITKELAILGYPPRLITKTLMYMQTHYDHNTWTTVFSAYSKSKC